ncbi:MAG: DMT family transporter [Candidatus Latescibacterota bacterium]|jgi:drug/metabolite transporter (DMT)-like permease
MNAIRCAVAGIAFWLVLPFDNTSLSGLLEVELAEWGMLFAALSLGVALGDTLYLIAIKEIGVSRTMALTGTFPLTTLFWQTVLLDAPFNPSLVLGSLLVVGGLFFLSRSGGGDAPPCGCSWAWPYRLSPPCAGASRRRCSNRPPSI